jgi:hypothetical protein
MISGPAIFWLAAIIALIALWTTIAIFAAKVIF